MTVITALQEWAQGHGYILLILSVCSLATFLGTLAVLPLMVARIPTTYFLRRKGTPEYRHPLFRFLYLVTKNLIGIIFFLSGLIMLFIPGQGLITMLVGVMLMNFPKKRTLALRIIRQREVSRAVTWMRKRSGRPPLLLPDREQTFQETSRSGPQVKG